MQHEFFSEGYLICLFVYLDGERWISINFPSCSTHFAANISSVKRLLETRARFRMADVASSDIESASAKECAYSDSVLAWYPGHRLAIIGLFR